MNEHKRAKDHLEVIAAILARTAHYQGLSARIALVAGLVTIGLSWGMLWWFDHFPGLTPRRFVSGWILAFVVVMAGWVALRAHHGKRHKDPADRKRARFIFFEMLPAWIACAGLTFWHALVIYEVAPLVIYWNLFYGLSLLALGEYAPRSLVVLGWAFLLAGLLMAPLFYLSLTMHGAGPVDGALAMAWTFGLFHLLYAAIVWPRRGKLFLPEAL